MSSRKMISVDFDGTIVEHDFPRIGKPMPYAIEVLKLLQEAGWKIILNTCREDHPTDDSKQYLTDALIYLKLNGVNIRSANENHHEDDFRVNGEKKRKVYAQVYVDDRNFGGFPGWDYVAFDLLDVRLGKFLDKVK